jgi:hypothetical protein
MRVTRLISPATFAAALALAALSAGLHAERLPDWAEAATRLQIPAYPDSVTSVLLLDDAEREISERGRIRTRYRGVLKVLHQQSGGSARASVSYHRGEDKVRSFVGWLKQPDGSVIRYRERDVIDMETSSDGVLYSDSRRQTLSVVNDAKIGSFFAWEYTLDERTLFAEDIWGLRSGRPILLSRLKLTLPTGWEALATSLNGAEFTETRGDRWWHWEARNIPPILDQPWSPPKGYLSTGIGILLRPAPESRNDYILFDSWNAVARYEARVSDGPAQPTPAIRAKAAELTAGASSSWEKIERLARFAQGLQYVAVSMNLGRGGGFTPNPADTILQCGYGDCKDKVAILRSLLDSIGVESYVMIVFAGGAREVDPDWPSPAQFNHAIIALRPPEGITVPTTIDHPTLGRLVIFDPTSENTVLGDLPEELQGTRGLIGADIETELVQLPILPPEANHYASEVKLVLSPRGSVETAIETVRTGQEAVWRRGANRNLTPTQLRELAVKILQEEVPGAELDEETVNDELATGTIRTQLRFRHATYARNMRDRLLIFKPLIWGRREWIPPESTIAERENPILIYPQNFEQVTTVQLPEGFVVDEYGENLELEEDFGHYSLTLEFNDTTLTVRRRHQTRRTLLPAADYERVRTYFGHIRTAENTPVVLMRKRS